MQKDLSFDRDRSVLIVIDMQNAFLDAQGSLSRMGLDTSRAKKAIAPIVKLKAAFAALERPVVYLRHVHRADGFDAGLISKVFPPIMELGHCKEGTWDSEIIPELKPAARDVIVDKFRFSGFYGTQLENVLRTMDADNLVVCGIATNICVESTVRDAFYRDYNVFVPVETTAAFFEDAEKAALENFRFAFARVVSMGDLVGQLAPA